MNIAITLVNDIISHIKRINNWVNNTNPVKTEIESILKNNISGIHTIKYESDVDIIEISHSIRNKKGFALGAVLAAEFSQVKIGIFGMNNLLIL